MIFFMSKVGTCNSEGIYLRLDNNNWLLKRAKWFVRSLDSRLKYIGAEKL